MNIQHINNKKYTDGIFYNQLLQLIQTASIEFDKWSHEVILNKNSEDKVLQESLTSRFLCAKELYFNAFDAIAFYRIRRYICNSIWNDFFLPQIKLLAEKFEIPESFANIKQVLEMENNPAKEEVETEQKSEGENK